MEPLKHSIFYGGRDFRLSTFLREARYDVPRKLFELERNVRIF